MSVSRASVAVLGLALLGGIAAPAEEPAAGAAGLKAIASGRVVRVVRAASGKSVLEEQVRADVLDVTQSVHEPYLFVAPSGEDLAPYFMGLLDARTSRWAVKLSQDESLDTPTCLGLSASGRFVAFEGGTSASARDLMIYDLQAKAVAHRTTIHAGGAQEFVPRWQPDDRLEYEIDAGPRVVGQLPLPKGSSRFNTYAQKAAWQDGRETRLPQYRKSFVE
jgi:hypothetical protein